MRTTLNHALATAVLACVFAGTATASHYTGTSPTLPGACAYVTLSYGPDAAAASIGTDGETDCYRFDGAAGDRVRLRVIRTAGALDATASVARPDGTTVCAATTADDSTCLLDAGGSHRIVVRDAAGAATGDYRISIQRLNAPVGCSELAFGTSTRSGALAATGETDCWRFSFNAATADRMRLRLVTAAAALDPRAEVLRPDGRTLCPATTDNDSTCLLNGMGTFTILVSDTPGTDTGGYALGIQRLDNPVGCSALQFGASAAAGSIVTTGETDCWAFNGSAGDVVRLRVITTAGTHDPVAEVVRPVGTTRCLPAAADETTCALDAAGSHTILVRDGAPGTRTGNYRIAIQRLNDPVGCSSLAFGPSSHAGAIAATAETDCWRFDGAAGDRVRLRLVATAGTVNAVTELIRPAGTTRCAPTAAGESTCVLDAAGTHTIIVRDSSGIRYGDYALAIQRLNAPAGCSTLSYATAATTGAIGTAAATPCWRFSSAPGERVGIRAYTRSGGVTPRAEVVRPGGTTRCARPAGHPSACALDATGDHTILVTDEAGTSTGGFVIAIQRLNLPIGCSTLPFGPVGAVGSIGGAADQTACWRFDGAGGDRVQVALRVTDQSGESVSAQVDVLRPDGTTICGASTLASSLSSCVLDAAGTHTLMTSNEAGVGSGALRISIQRLNEPAGCSALQHIRQTSGVIGTAAQIDCWRFDATAGERQWVRLESDDGWDLDTTLTVHRPDGTELPCATAAWYSEQTYRHYEEKACTFDASGTHSVLVRARDLLWTGGYSLLKHSNIFV